MAVILDESRRGPIASTSSTKF